MSENNKDKIDLEAYKQAHETRRQWERHIWQYGVVSVGISTIMLSAANTIHHFSFFHKIIILIISVFSVSMLSNVYRSRELMKCIEKRIEMYHRKNDIELINVPSELNKSLVGVQNISSTKVAVFAHAFSSLVLIIMCIYVWVN